MFAGQGAQHRGMGGDLFDRHRDLTEVADELLGYSIKELCLDDPDENLRRTEYTQPALFVVNALTYTSKIPSPEEGPDFLIGHSLGEYNALWAAGAIDFPSGVRLVRKRGELMATASGGGMAAIMGVEAERVADILYNFAFDNIDIANYNSPSQTVIAGPREEIEDVELVFKEAGASVVRLNVSGAFHSRMMRPVENEFREFLQGEEFAETTIPVISNATAKPYERGEERDTLARQISNPVRWVESISLLGKEENPEFEEAGPGTVLTNLVSQIIPELASL